MSINTYALLSIWSDFLNERRVQLANNVSSAVGFDAENPPLPSDEKDAYFTAINNDGATLIRNGQVHLADKYYGDLLVLLDALINERQKIEPSFTLNKGQVYVNYGIAQLLSGKTDEGIAHILTAFKEDEPYHQEDEQERAIVDSPLYAQFERNSYSWLFGHITRYHANLQQVTVNTTAADFVRLMRAAWSGVPGTHAFEHRLVLLGTLHDLQTTDALLMECPLGYTKGRLSLGLREICTFVESVLRDKAIASPNPCWASVTESEPLLAGLLENMPNALVRQYVSSGLGSTRNSPFSDRISDILGKPETTTDEVIAKALTMTLLVRNYSSHNYYVGDDRLFVNRHRVMPLLLYAAVFIVMDF